MSKKLTQEEFIKGAREVHKDRYDYSLVEYINRTTKVKIICRIHGVFEQTPADHLRGRGCFECNGKKKYTTNEFKQKSKQIHGDKYDYSLVEYVNNTIKIKIICSKHGMFEQIPQHHLKGHGCRKCALENTQKIRTTKTLDFIIKANNKHNNRYIYDNVNIITLKTKVSITCPIHGDFRQRPEDHLKGHGCSYCSSNKIYNAIPLNELKKIVKENNIKTQQQYRKWWKSNKDWCRKNGIPCNPDSVYKKNN
ncbi:MAG: hypothetical protein ACOC3V_04255 [bacterium]